MKKIILAVLLGLSIAQVAPVLADDSVVTETAKKESLFKAHKKAIIVALSFAAVATVAGVDALAIKKGWDKGYNKAAFDKAVAAVTSTGSFLKFWGKGWKKNVGIAALDLAILFVLADLGNTIILKRPELAKTLYNKVKSVKSNKAVAK